MTMMFFLLPNSRQTRRTIWSGVSVNPFGSPCARIALVSLPAATFSRSQEGMEVGDENLGLPKLLQAIRRNDVALAVVVLRIVGQEHAQPVADGDAGRDDEERVRESGVLRIGQLVERLPRDKHGHHDGLAGAGGHFQGHAGQAGVRRVVRLAEPVLNPGVAVFPGHLDDVDGRFQGLDLTEEQLLLAVGSVQ